MAALQPSNTVAAQNANPSTPDYAGALAAGYTPSQLIAAGGNATDLLNAMQGTKGAPDIAGARKAGYSDDALIQALSTHLATPTPDGSLGNALYQGLIHGAPAGLEQGASDAIKYAGRLVGDGGKPDAVTNWLDSHAQANNQALAQNYQAPADAPQSVTDAIGNSTGALNAAGRLGSFAVRKVAENAGSLAPNLALGLALPEAGLMRAGVTGYDFLQNLGGVHNANAAAGVNTTNGPSTLDMLNAGGQTALMGANPLGRGANLAGRVAGSVVDGASKGAVQSAANDTGALVQGGNLGADPMGSILSHALDAGVAGAALGGPLAAARESAGNVQNFLTTRKAGPNMQAYQAETSDWQNALDGAKQHLQQANPGMDPSTLEQEAYRLAQTGYQSGPAQAPRAAMGPADPVTGQPGTLNEPLANPSAPGPAPGMVQGVAPPSFQNMSPQAQQGMAEQATLQMYDASRKSITENMGRPDFNPAPAQVFKDVLGRVTDALSDTASSAQQAGILTKDQAGTLKAAVAQAKQHNSVQGENGQSVGYFDTLRDQVAALPLEPPMMNQVLQMLRVADISSQAALYKNAVGPLQRNASLILGAAGAAGDHLTGGMLGPLGGAVVGQSIRGPGTTALGKLDGILGMGGGIPDILARRAAINAYASQNGLTGVADPLAVKSPAILTL